MADDVLAQLAPEVARLLHELTGLPIAVADAHGRALATFPADRNFCPLLVRDAERAPPLPPRCECCPRVEALLAADLERLAACPHHADAVRVLTVNGAAAGFVATALAPKEFAPVVARARPALHLAEVLLEAAIAADRRERLGRELVAPRLLAALARADRALDQVRRVPAGSPERDEIERLRESIDVAVDVLESLRAAPRPAADVASRAVEEVSESA
jgi:hypothetical protein